MLVKTADIAQLPSDIPRVALLHRSRHCASPVYVQVLSVAFQIEPAMKRLGASCVTHKLNLGYDLNLQVVQPAILRV